MERSLSPPFLTLCLIRFSKRADVPALKKELVLRQSQLLNSVVNDLQNVLGPRINQTRTSFDFEDDGPADPLPIFDDATRSALADTLKANEGRLHDARTAIRLPAQIQRYNGLIFWLILVSGIAAAISFLLVVSESVSAKHFWVMLCVPVAFVLATVHAACLRHVKVEYAERQVLENDSQA